MKSEWNTCTNILCVRPDSMGDVLMTTPAFRALKQTFPHVRLTLLTSSSGSAIADHIPEIDDVITANFPWEKTDDYAIDSEKFFELVLTVQQRQFDAAIIFTVFSQHPLLSALFCYLAKIPRRLAYSHQKPYDLLTDWIPDKEPDDGIRHEVERQLSLVSAIGARTDDTRLSLKITDNTKEQVIRLVTSLGIDVNKPFVIVHPGAASAKRRYSPLGFSEIIKRLSDAGYQIMCTGDTTEDVLVQLIIKQSQGSAWSLAGKLTLSELIALIDVASLLISNNTGPAHIASAVGTPVVVLYALTNPQHTPWHVPSSVLYFPVSETFKDIIVSSAIPQNALPLESPKQVVDQALRLLQKTRNTLSPYDEKRISSYTNI